MRRFLKYPVYVNHPGRYVDARQRQIDEIRWKDRRTATPQERASDLSEHELSEGAHHGTFSSSTMRYYCTNYHARRSW